MQSPTTPTRILVATVDRDDDIGVKGNIETPIVGAEECSKAASSLALADPEEADANTIFAAVKECDELRRRGVECDVAVIAGDRSGGFAADSRIRAQLQKVMAQTRTDSVYLITDGVSDHELLPVLRSFVPVVSVRRVVIKHSRSVEESYAILGRYLRMLIYDSRYSRFALGIPGVLILLGGLLTYFNLLRETLLLSALIIGSALVIRGFSLDKVAAALPSLRPSGYVRLFSLAASVLIVAAATYQGYTVMSSTEEHAMVVAKPDLILSFGAYLLGIFLLNAVDFLWIGFRVSLGGAVLYHGMRRSVVAARDLVWLVVLALLYVPIREFSQILVGQRGLETLVAYLLIGLAATFLSVTVAYQHVQSKKKSKAPELE